MKKRPTVSQLEAILQSEGQYAIEIQSDGSIKAVKGKPRHKKFKLATFQEALGGDY